MPTCCLLGESIRIRRATKKMKKKGKKKSRRRRLLCFGHQLAEILKNCRKAEGTPRRSHRHNQQRKANADVSIDRLFGRGERRQAKKMERKSKSRQCQPFCSIGVSFCIGQATKKERSKAKKNHDANSSFISATNSQNRSSLRSSRMPRSKRTK